MVWHQTEDDYNLHSSCKGVGETVAEFFFMVEFQNWIANKKNNERLGIRRSKWDSNGVPTDCEALHCTVLTDKAIMFRPFGITDDLWAPIPDASSVIFHHLLWVSVENFPGFFSKLLWYLVIFVSHTK